MDAQFDLIRKISAFKCYGIAISKKSKDGKVREVVVVVCIVS